MLSSKSEDNKGDTSTSSEPGSNTRRGSVVNRRTGLKAALKISMRTPKPQSLPSYLVKVLLSLVQARLEAQVWFVCCLWKTLDIRETFSEDSTELRLYVESALRTTYFVPLSALIFVFSSYILWRHSWLE